MTPMEIERKYLIRRPAPRLLEKLGGRTEIVQTYLSGGDGFSARVRRRGTPEGGYTYTHTQKRTLSPGERVELEREITAEEYEAFLRNADPARHTVEKERYCFDFEGQFFELDVYPWSRTLAVLEIELPSLDTPVRLPDFLDVLVDVTEKPGYTNYALSEKLSFPGDADAAAG